MRTNRHPILKGMKMSKSTGNSLMLQEEAPVGGPRSHAPHFAEPIYPMILKLSQKFQLVLWSTPAEPTGCSILERGQHVWHNQDHPQG